MGGRFPKTVGSPAEQRGQQVEMKKNKFESTERETDKGLVWGGFWNIDLFNDLSNRVKNSLGKVRGWGMPDLAAFA